ncbi:MAG: hypothetical protein HQL39_03175 [Alphaproteobacteria bacterium]|nr:hypothetical protein [Alphaproteobacteria bacterium]
MTYQMTEILPTDESRLDLQGAILRYAGPPAILIAGAVIATTVGSWIMLTLAFAGVFK